VSAATARGAGFQPAMPAFLRAFLVAQSGKPQPLGLQLSYNPSVSEGAEPRQAFLPVFLPK
jgi:hypothetical protein